MATCEWCRKEFKDDPPHKPFCSRKCEAEDPIFTKFHLKQYEERREKWREEQAKEKLERDKKSIDLSPKRKETKYWNSDGTLKEPPGGCCVWTGCFFPIGLFYVAICGKLGEDIYKGDLTLERFGYFIGLFFVLPLMIWVMGRD